MTSFSDAEIARAVAAYKKHGSERAAASALGLSKTATHARLVRAAAAGDLGFRPVLPGFEIKKTATNLKGGKVEGEWIQQHKAAGDVFKVPEGQLLNGVSAYVDEAGRWRSGWIKTKNDPTRTDAVKILKDTFKAYRGRSQLVPAPRRVDRDLLTVYPIADQHLGLLSWGRETGADYDLKIGIERLLDCASAVVSRSERSRESLIVNLGDWFHANDQRNVTPKSKHQLDVDGRWYKVLQAGIRTMMRIIDLNLAKHETVEVVNIPGNHDPESSRAQAIALATFYENNRRVKIAFPGDLYFRRYGATLIGAAHGDKMRPDRMAWTMATQQRKAWGETAYHWFLFGHIHHESAKEVGDVRCESFQTLADKDSHANGAGYNSGQSLNAITLHKRKGEDGRHRVNIPPPCMR